MTDKLSVIIPSYRDPYLNMTVDSILHASKGDIEIIVFLDGHRDVPRLIQDDRVLYIASEDNVGMRPAINECVKKATGKYIIKFDSHCNVGKGFDEILKRDSQPNQISIPSRYHLDVETWDKFNGPINHVFLKFPDNFDKEIGFRTKERKQEISYNSIDEIIIFQGSCWFMEKAFFEKIGGLDVNMFGTWGMEAQELSMKTWLCHGGKVVRNKNIWYAHYKKKIQKRSMRKNMLKNMQKVFSMCMLNDWPGQKETFKWLIDKWPLYKNWPLDWYTPEYINSLKKNMICT